MQSEQLIVLAVMIFVLIIFTLGKSPLFRVDRTGSVLIAVSVLLCTKINDFLELVSFVDFQTITILFCMMVIVANLRLAGMFELVGNLLNTHINSERKLLLAVIIMSGFLSAIAINDIVCLLFTPIVIMVCNNFGVAAKPHLIGLAIASNIGSAGSLIGNPQNILVASLSGISFSFYISETLPIVLLGLVLSYFWIAFQYRASLKKVVVFNKASNCFYHKYLLLKSSFVLLGIVVGYMLGHNLLILTLLGASLLLLTRRVNPNKIYRGIDFNLLIMFVGLFAIIGSIEKSGLLELLLKNLSSTLQDSFIFFIGLTVVLSNIVSNVPAVLLLKNFIHGSDTEIWWTSLALVSTVAGNLTLFGSMANLIVVEIAKGKNIKITAGEYFKIGCPLTIVLTIVAYFKMLYKL